MSRSLRFTLLGTGSSGGVPRVGNDWGACDPSEPKNRRLRCSALIEILEGDVPIKRVLIDTSPDLREQLLSQSIDCLDAILFTHDHADQTHGIDDVRALVLRNRKWVPVYMDKATRSSLTRKFNYIFKGQGDYPPILDIQNDLKAGQELVIDLGDETLRVLPLDQKHGRIRSLGFRIGSMAYCNDVEDFPDDTFSKLHGLELFVVDALRYTPHPSHAHLERVLEWIKRLKPKRTILTNLHIDMDYQKLKSELPDGVEPGFDGWSAEIF